MLLLRAERTHQAELSQEAGNLQAVQSGGPLAEDVQIIEKIWRTKEVMDILDTSLNSLDLLDSRVRWTLDNVDHYSG